MVSSSQLERQVQKERNKAEEERKVRMLQNELKTLKNRNKITASKVFGAIAATAKQTGTAIRSLRKTQIVQNNPRKSNRRRSNFGQRQRYSNRPQSYAEIQADIDQIVRDL